MQSSSQNVTKNKPTPSFYRLDALSVAQPVVSKHWTENSGDRYLVKSESSYLEVCKLLSSNVFHSQVIKCLWSRLRPILLTFALSNTQTERD